MKLYLVQHAEAKPEQEDPRRPLTEKGEADAKRLADFLKKLVRADRILHSGKLRAVQTAQVLAEELKPPEVSVGSGLNPLDDSSAWVERLASMDEDLMLVGHMPHLEKLASRLLCGDERLKLGFEPGSAVCLERDASGAWALGWMVKPGHLETVR